MSKEKKGSCWQIRREGFSLWMKDFDTLLSAKTLLDVLECCVNVIFDQENGCLAQISFCLAQICCVCSNFGVLCWRYKIGFVGSNSGCRVG
jgi:hypothetical protein